MDNSLFIWNEISIKALLLIVREYKRSDLSKGRNPGFFYNILENGLLNVGYCINKSAIQRKWKYLRERYSFIKRNDHLYDGKKQWEYMGLMEELLEGEEDVDKFEMPKATTSASSGEAETENAGQQTSEQPASDVAPTSTNPSTSTLLPKGTDDESIKEGINPEDKAAIATFTEVFKSTFFESYNGGKMSTKDLLAIQPAPITQSNNPAINGDVRSVSPQEKSDASETNGITVHLETCGSKLDEEERNEKEEPPKKRRRGKRPETNTERIIWAMEEEGEKDRAILRQFMKEFSSAAESLSSAIRQISSMSNE